MITLFVNNPLTSSGYLELDNPQVTINIEAKSIKSPSTIKTPYTYSFTAPLTSNNSHLLGTPHSISTYNHSRIPATLSITSPSISYSGYIIIDSCTKDSYSINFYGGLGNIFHSLQYKTSGEDLTLLDLFESYGLSGSYIHLTPENVLLSRSLGKLGFHSDTGEFLFDALLARYGWDNQSKKLYTSGDTSIDISSYSASKHWPVDSITGSYLPFQFGDFRVENLQPVLNIESTFFSILSSYLSTLGYSLSIDPSATPSVNHGIALPKFSIIDDSNLYSSELINISNNTVISPSSSNAAVYFRFNIPSFFDFVSTYTQSVFILTSSTDTIVIAKNINSSLRSRFPSAKFYNVSVDDSSPVKLYNPIRVYLTPGSVYTVTQGIQEVGRAYDTEVSYVSHTPVSTTYLAVTGAGTYTTASFVLSDNVGYVSSSGSWVAGRTEAFNGVRSGINVPIKDYLQKSETPLYYLLEYCRALGYHITLNGTTLTISADYTDSPASTVSSTITNIQIDSISPQVYNENSLIFKFDSNDDWFSSQYNSIFDERPVGSSDIIVDTTSGVDNTDKFEFSTTKLKYAPYSSGIYNYYSYNHASHGSTKITTIGYSDSGNSVDFTGTLFGYGSINILTTDTSFFGISYDSSDDPGVIDLDYSPTASRYRTPIGNTGLLLNIPCTLADGYDLVSYGLLKYTNTVSAVDYSLSDCYKYSNNVSMHYCNNAYDDSSDAFAAKYIKLTAVLTGDINPFVKYELPNIGILLPIKISIAAGKDIPTVSIEGLIYTSDPVSHHDASKVNINVSPYHGTVTGAGEYNIGSTVTLVFTPETPGYEVKSGVNPWSGLPATAQYSTDKLTVSFVASSNIDASVTATVKKITLTVEAFNGEIDEESNKYNILKYYNEH